MAPLPFPLPHLHWIWHQGVSFLRLVHICSSLPTTRWSNQICRTYTAGIFSNLATWDKLTGSLLWSGDRPQEQWQDYKTVKIQISGCNLVNYIDRISKGWDFLTCSFSNKYPWRACLMERNPKLCLTTNYHYCAEFLNPSAFTRSSPNFMENITMLSSKPELLIMHKSWISPSMLLSHLNNLYFCKAYDF